MTTRVIVAVPPFNHKGVRVEVLDNGIVTETHDLNHMTVHELHLTDTRSLRLSELDIEGAAPTPSPTYPAPVEPAPEPEPDPAPAAEG